MKKLLFISTFLLSGFLMPAQVMFQSGFESWTDTHHPVGFWGSKTSFAADSVNQYTTSVHGGTYAVQLISMTTSHKRLSTVAMPVDSNVIYTVTFWVRGHGSIRTGIYDNRAGTSSGYFYNSYIAVNSSSWTQETQTITAAKTYSYAEFIFSVKSTVADLDHIQIDDVNITSPSSSSPSLTILTPANNAVIYTTSTNVTFITSYFSLGTDGQVSYSVNGGAAQTTTSNLIALSGLPQGANSITLELVDMNGQPLSTPVTATVNFTVSMVLPTFVSIHDIQYTTDASGNSPYMGDTLSTAGIVTGKFSSGFFIQSGTGPWSGLYVYSTTAAAQVTMGDSVTVVGVISEYYNETELGSISYTVVNSSSNTLPAPSILPASQINTEPYEGVLVKIQGATCAALTNANYMWTVFDGDSCKIHDLLYTYTPVLNHIYNVEGPLNYTHSVFCIEPRMISDVQDVTGVQENKLISVQVFPNPASENLNVVSPSTIKSVQIADINGRLVYTKNEVNNSTMTIPVNKFAKGNYILQLNFDNNLIGVYKFER